MMRTRNGIGLTAAVLLAAPTAQAVTWGIPDLGIHNAPRDYADFAQKISSLRGRAFGRR